VRILIVEDKRNMAQMLKRALEEKTHSAVLAFTGKDALAQVQAGSFDALVLDLMLPDIDGFEVAKKIREARNQVPILVLTARDTVSDTVRALDLGVDDYLTKPFALAEFMARLRAVTRRGPVIQGAQLQINDLKLNPATGEVTRAGKTISLTKTEHTLLEFFMRRPNRILSRETIIQGVWGGQDGVEPNTVEAFVKLLRAKIDDQHEVKLIHTVRGFGYRLQQDGES
jgi:DNA-binding response OmpR family regulator